MVQTFLKGIFNNLFKTAQDRSIPECKTLI